MLTKLLRSHLNNSLSTSQGERVRADVSPAFSTEELYKSRD
jgi:hypothetical protein